MEDARLLIQHVAGFKLFRLGPRGFASQFVEAAWEAPGDVRARCLPAELPWQQYVVPGPHASPHSDCRCGIHAWRSPLRAAVKHEPGLVFAAVACSGLVVPHRDGFRAEVARVVAVHDPLDRQRALAACGRLEATPCRSLAELEEAAMGAAAPLPPSGS